MENRELEELILLRKQDYYRIAYSFLGNEADSLDAISDMTLIVLKKINQLKDSKQFYAWSNTILVNCCRKILKRRKKEPVSEEWLENITVFGSNFTQFETFHDLKLFLSKLSMKYQEVIIMRYFLELNNQEISSILKIPEGTVKSRLSNGLKELKSKIGGEYNE